MSKSELATCYCPHLTQSGARRKLLQWINDIPGLRDSLIKKGYTKDMRILTPAMVSVIVEAIGEP